MRVRQAIRYLQRRYEAGDFRHNPEKVVRSCSAYSLTFNKNLDSSDIRRYSLTFEQDLVRKVRTHWCACRLIIIVSEEILLKSEMIQGQHSSIRGDPQMGKYIRDQVDCPLVEMPETKHRYPSKLPPRRPRAQQAVIDEWKAGLSKELQDEIDLYHHASEVESEELRAKALIDMSSAALPGHMDLTEAMEIVKLFMYSTLVSDKVESSPLPITSERLMSIPMTSSSSGALPLSPADGVTHGSKQLMASAAAVCANTVQAVPYEANDKDEVIKKGKKVRNILCESSVIYLKFKHLFGKGIGTHGLVANGDTMGISKARGNITKIFYSYFFDYQVFHPEATFEEFMKVLEHEGLEENDKEGWESTTERRSGFCYVTRLLASTNIVPENIEHAAQVLSNYLCPLIKFDGNTCLTAPYLVGSGSLGTFDGNTSRHRSCMHRVVIFIYEHGMTLGRDDCNCNGCRLGFRDDVSLEDLSKVAGGSFHGDDYLGRVAFGDKVAQLMDAIMGTKTTGGAVPLDQAEFLRTRFKLYWENGTVFIMPFRTAGRVFAKIVHGTATDIASSCTSASLELGDNEKGNEEIQRLFSMAYPNGTNHVVRRDSDALPRGDGLIAGDPLKPFLIDEVRLKQGYFAKPFMDAMAAWNYIKNEDDSL